MCLDHLRLFLLCFALAYRMYTNTPERTITIGKKTAAKMEPALRPCLNRDAIE